MSQYFPEPFEHSGGNVNIELDLSHYVTKANLKGGAGVGIKQILNKYLANLKTKVNDFHVDKFKNVPVDLSMLSNIVDNVVKKTAYNQFVTKLNTTNTKIPSTSELVTKTQYDSDKKGLQKRIEDVDKNKTASITGLVTTEQVCLIRLRFERYFSHHRENRK